MEAYNGTHRITRGGDYNTAGNTYPASVRYNLSPESSNINTGARAVLYIVDVPYGVNITTPTKEDVTITLTKTRTHNRISNKTMKDGKHMIVQ